MHPQKLIPLLALALAGSLPFAAAASPNSHNPDITKDQVIEYINAFKADPTAPDAKRDGSFVMLYANQGKGVTVDLNDLTDPLIANAHFSDQDAVVIASFFVGSVEAQLNGTKDSPNVAGVRQEIATYHQVQKKFPQYKAAAIEKLEALDSQGKLQAYLTHQ